MSHGGKVMPAEVPSGSGPAALWARHKGLFTHPLFWGVLIAKVVASFLFSSTYTDDLWIPFVSHWIDSGFENPWDHALAEGNLKAFPYASGMLWLLAGPSILPGLLFGFGDLPHPVQLFLLRVPLLIADTVIYVVLCQWFVTRRVETLVLYWCSPILFFISYVHGQIDAIPTALLHLSIAALLTNRRHAAGALLGLGLATKLHLAIAVPFFVAYLLRHGSSTSARWRAAGEMLAVTAGTAGLFFAPTWGSEGFQRLVLRAEEMTWVYDVALPVGPDLVLYLAPAVTFALLVHFTSYRRVSQDLLILYLGLVFVALILFVPPMPGWAFWSVPFLCYFVIRERMARFLPFWAYTVCYLVYFGGFADKAAVVPASWWGGFPEALAGRLEGLSFSGMQASLGLLALWIGRAGVARHGVTEAAVKPLAVGIGGDSGSGKHSLGHILSDVVGPQHVVSLFGDDYHKWERGDPNWQRLTHHDPNSNYFRQPARHLAMLKQGGAIRVRRYDHRNGRFTEPVRLDGQPYVFFVGLHPFVFQRTRDLFDIRIFMDTDPALQQEWKIRRDMAKRGYTREAVVEQIERRAPDVAKFIAPQVKHATWSVGYAPDGPLDGEELPPLQVTHRIASDFVSIQSLASLLQERAGDVLEVRWTVEDNLLFQELSVRGHLSAERIEALAADAVPDLAGLLMQHTPTWRAGIDGISQLVFLCLLEELSTASAPAVW